LKLKDNAIAGTERWFAMGGRDEKGGGVHRKRSEYCKDKPVKRAPTIRCRRETMEKQKGMGKDKLGKIITGGGSYQAKKCER